MSSASFFTFFLKQIFGRIYFCSIFASAFENRHSVSLASGSLRLGVRTPGFHPGNRGSIPLGTTSKNFKNFIFTTMANHQSAKKRIRQAEARKVHNKYYAKTARNAVKSLRLTTDKTEASTQYPKVVALIDKLAKKNIIHKNKASNLKASLAKHINTLA